MPLYQQKNLPKSVRLTDEEYARAQLKFPKYCHDVVIIDIARKGFWLPERRDKQKNGAGIWFIGGQVEVFVPIKESLAKVFKRETKLDIHPDRFRHELQNRYFFDGSDGVLPHDAACEIFSLELFPKEFEAIDLDLSEYLHKRLSFFGSKEIARIENITTRAIFTDLWNTFYI